MHLVLFLVSSGDFLFLLCFFFFAFLFALAVCCSLSPALSGPVCSRADVHLEAFGLPGRFFSFSLLG